MFQRYVKSRKSIAACMAAAWLILFGVVLAEGLGLYEDTPENLDQRIEKVLSSDAITGDHAPDLTSVAHSFITAAVSLPALDTLCTSPHLSINSGERIAPITKGLELYRLYSTYLI